VIADPAVVVVSALLGYFVGGIPFGVLAARLRGVDLAAVGSGNIGATNVGRALGRRWGLLVLILDVAKGALPVVLVAPILATSGGEAATEALAASTGVGAVLGHCFSPYLGFSGGKGVATSIGVVGALAWWWIALPLVAYAAVRKLAGFVSAGSLALAALLPAAALLHVYIDGRGGWPKVAAAGLAGVVIVLRHVSNIRRLLRGEENEPSPAGGAADAERSASESRETRT
jgi:glycerol-3-phosphate acyltransferase PlsY